MEYLKNIFLFIIISFLFKLSFGFTELEPIIFGDKEKFSLKGTGIFRTIATYSTDDKGKYLYIYPKNFESKMYLNKAIIKIYFKKYSNDDKNANYLESEYSTLEFNSGLFIKLDEIKYTKASIFFLVYEEANLSIIYKYVDNISFPSYSLYSNFLLNQFIIQKDTTIKIDYEKQQVISDDFLLILTKTSLRNIDVTVNYKEKDVTKDILANLYPNGCSIYMSKNNIEKYEVIITNKNSEDEILLLGYMHHINGEIFTNQLVNGYQMYIEGNSNKIFNLPNVAKNKHDEYFTYQTFSKDLVIEFVDSNNINENSHEVCQYNLMMHYNVDSNGVIRFDFYNTPKRSSLYIQYIDYKEIEVAQKSLQSLVTGSPKSMLIPEGKSMYHFLPKEKDAKNLNFYLRPKTPNDQKMFVSFKTCKNYPEECSFTKKDDISIIPINNIGLWFSEKKVKNELQLIYIYCESECSYDIIMTYDNDPLFLFPENNYSKFINDNNKDIFILPVFEFLSKNESINIDLSVISGKAKLSLYKSIDKFDSSTRINGVEKKIGLRQTYTISKDLFTSADYYKKDIYALIEGDKNTFYNLMYGNGASNNKILDNNRVIIESVSVVNDEAENKKSFTFINQIDKVFYISISTPVCKSKILINGKEKSNNKNNYLYQVSEKGSHIVQVFFLVDNLICKSGYEGEVIFYAYNEDNTNILLSENTFVNTSFTGKEITFKHIFKPNTEENADNSFNIEVERLSEKPVKLVYKLERNSFNISELKESNYYSLSTYILAKKNNLISSKQVKNICGSLRQNEICILSLTFSTSPNPDEFFFSLYLNKNGHNYARHLFDESLINTVNPNSVQYYYIDVFKNYDTEILINSYGQDLQYCYQIKKSSDDESTILPFDNSQFKSGSNYHKIIIETGDYCSETFCKIYLGVGAIKNKLDKEVPITFEISYLLKEKTERKTEVKLPLNYFTLYNLETTNDIKEITYSIQTYDSSDLLFEIYTIKENEDDTNSEVTASVSDSKFTSNEGKYLMKGIKPSKLTITIQPSSPTVTKSTFKLRVSSIGKSTDNQIIPILPYSSEKCEIKQNSACYYTFDLSPDNEAEIVYFYIPESEYAYISIDEFEYGYFVEPKKSISLSQDLKISSKDKLQRSNWLEYIIPKEKNSTILIKVASQIEKNINLTFYSSFYNKPEVVTLNHGEKKIFTIESNKINEMKINIKKSFFSYNKYKINIHAVKGDGVFKVLGQLYPLGINGNNKENIIIVIDELEKDLEIIVNNTKDETSDEFTFTIHYTIITMNHLFNELEPSTINSYKFIKPTDTKLPEIAFYMKVNSTEEGYQNVNMNIKIYTNISTFEINSYIVNEEFIKGKSKDIKKSPENKVGKITPYIQGGSSNGGELTLSKLEIESKEINENKKDNKQLYIYITFNQKERKDNKVKIDIYPYDISNNLPLTRNELFIEKLVPQTKNYQLLLVKSDISSNDMIVEYLSPSSNKYKIAIEYDRNKKDYFANSNETELIKNENDFKYFGKNKIKLNINSGQDSKNLRYLLFNIFANEGKTESKEDLFIFKYRNQNDEIFDIYNDGDKDFNVEGTTSNITFTLDVTIPKYSTGNSILIFNAYKEDNVKDLNLNEENMALYLFFSNTPVFTMYKALDKNQVKKSIQKSFTTTEIKFGGTYYFTCVSVIEDNEREEYLGYKAVKLTLETSDTVGGLLDYMKNHVFATVLIIIIILFVLGMLVHECRNEKSPQVSVNIEKAGELMKEM